MLRTALFEDYGYQINGLSNRTTLADGNTWNHAPGRYEKWGAVRSYLAFPKQLYNGTVMYLYAHAHTHTHIYIYIDI